mgnify:CR=1 FL=1
MALETICKGKGMFSMGNMKPLKRMVGSIMPIMDMSMAACWVLVFTEMSRPRDRQVMMNKILSANNKKMLPFTGRSSTKTLSSKMEITFINDKKR